MVSLDERHHDEESTMLRRSDDLARNLTDTSSDCRRLIGADVSQEYPFQAAAILDPSAVLHPQPGSAAEGEVRFLLSLRGIGEGHVSSVTFRAGAWNPFDGTMRMEPSSRTTVSPVIHRAEPQGRTGRGRSALPRRPGAVGNRAVSHPAQPAQPAPRHRGCAARPLRRWRRGRQASGHLYRLRRARRRMRDAADRRFREFREAPADRAYNGIAVFPRRVDRRFAALGRWHGAQLSRGRPLLLPYGAADNFATVGIDELLGVTS